MLNSSNWIFISHTVAGKRIQKVVKIIMDSHILTNLACRFSAQEFQLNLHSDSVQVQMNIYINRLLEHDAQKCPIESLLRSVADKHSIHTVVQRITDFHSTDSFRLLNVMLNSSTCNLHSNMLQVNVSTQWSRELPDSNILTVFACWLWCSRVPMWIFI